MNSNTKTEFIKIRVTKQEKEQLKKLAGSSESLSAYILARSLPAHSVCQELVIATVNEWDLLNTIILEIKKSGNEYLEERIKNIITRRWKNEL